MTSHFIMTQSISDVKVYNFKKILAESPLQYQGRPNKIQGMDDYLTPIVRHRLSPVTSPVARQPYQRSIQIQRGLAVFGHVDVR